MTERSRGRGQLVVAGSVAIAVAIVAVAVLSNAALYTEEIASVDQSEDVAAAERYQRTAQTDLRRLVNATVRGTEETAEAALRRNVSAYAGQLERAAGRSGATAIQIELAAASPPTYRLTFVYESPSVQYQSTITVRAEDP